MRSFLVSLSFLPLVLAHCGAQSVVPQNGLIFRASLERSATADFAAGDPEPLVARGVRFSSGAGIPPNACLAYDAHANLYAEQGTVSFWWRPDEPPGRLGFPLFSASFEQHSTWDYTFARIEWNGSQLAARIRDRDMEFHSVRVPAKPVPGAWMHLALAWNESGGLRLYLDGRLAGSVTAPLDLDARLDQFGLLCRAVTPHHTAGNENPGSIAEVRIYRMALGAADVARLASRKEPAGAAPEAANMAKRLGWDEAANIPTGRAFIVRRVPVEVARDVQKLCLKGLDGKRETLWPVVSHGYVDEGKTYTIYPAAEPVNLLRTTGNLRGRIFTPSGIDFVRSGESELRYFKLARPITERSFTVARQSGALGDLQFLRVEERPGAGSGSWIRFGPSKQPDFRDRRAPGTYAVWKANGSGSGPNAPYHYFVVPVQAVTALGAVRLRLTSAPGAYYYLSVKDPVATARELIEFDARATGEWLDVTLDFPDVIVPPGKNIVITLASSNPRSPALEAQLIPADPVRARQEHLKERMWQIRDSFQMLSEARPWMQIGRRTTRPALRRELKLVDELFALLEDVRGIDPNHQIATAYWSWINRFEPPPPYQEPAPPDPGVPLWAHRQLLLLKHFRNVAEWWIDQRQVESGEIGGGLGDDTDMVQNWPAIGLLDGPSEKIRSSVRRVVEACYAQGLIDRGMNARLTDALHAYEEGMNAYAPAFLLDYGNPVLFERMMETASHYPRLTGINKAGHRHFRSYQYSSTDLVEEGYHAREDIYSHLILHPGLYVAWYNGSPPVKGLLKELADSLLAHWKTERYPRLAKGIFFADDRVETRAAPNSETFNLFWGLYDMDRNPAYLWLLREAVKAGDIWNACFANGLWIDAFDLPSAREALAREVGRRNIFDHNLQTDQAGLVARVLAFQAGGDLSLVEDAHRALVQHMAQNMYLYTEAEQFTDRVWIPTLSVQRERLGGVAHYRNYIYPAHAVSWERTGGEVAALVTAARPDYLRVRLFNAGPKPRKAIARIWQLENGRYETVLKDEEGSILSARTEPLKRYSALELDLPARRPLALEIRQVSKGVPVSRLPDLAVAAEEVTSGKGLKIPVHNIGAIESRPFTVTVRGVGGTLLGESRHPPIPAPADLKPKVTLVQFPNIAFKSGLRISVKQDNGEEITDANNEIVTR